MVEVILKSKRTIYGEEKQPGKSIFVRDEMAVRWVKDGIAEYPTKEKQQPKKKPTKKTDGDK